MLFVIGLVSSFRFFNFFLITLCVKENERANKEDKPWLCMIPNLIGIIATLIGIGKSTSPI